MKPRIILALLLILAVTATTLSRPLTRQDETEKITPEEEREAIEFGERFARQLHSVNNLAPLMAEMFVSDYAERLQQQAVTHSITLLGRRAAQQASRDEIKRYYLALNNGVFLGGLLDISHEFSQLKEDDEDDGDLRLAKMLSPELLRLFESDPILAALLEDERRPDAPSAEEPKEQESRTVQPNAEAGEDEGIIQSVEQLRSFTVTLEQSALLMRKQLATLPIRPALWERHEKGANEAVNMEKEREWMNPRLANLRDDFYGYPRETRVICLNVLTYHIDLVKVDGRFKILALEFNFD
ncbi:MAG: hypothetical protein H0T45_16075 [Pyrinomonadaceae bacterium]|nr:hypothetical protein [Pyrinomonadaceae bacterium]